MKSIKQHSTATVLSEITGALFFLGGFGVAAYSFVENQNIFIAIGIITVGLFLALVLNLMVEILQSVWRAEGHLAKGNYDYCYVNKLGAQAENVD
jgi:hypothetical protein